MKRARGLTLVELIATIAVIATAGAALLGTLSYLEGSGGLAIRQVQAQSIAEAYLSEIRGMSFADPDGLNEGGNRRLWDNVMDYQGLNQAIATDKQGNTIGRYPVRVAVAAGGLPNLPANAVWRIDVSVDYDTNATVTVTGYRSNRP